MIKSFFNKFYCVGIFFLLNGCDGTKETSLNEENTSTTDVPEVKSVGAKVYTNLKISSDAKDSLSFSFSNLNKNFKAPKNIMASLSSGGTSASELKSLKYYIKNIQICQDLTTQGTAFSNPQGCITLYTGPSEELLNPATVSEGTPDYAALADRAKTVTEGYIDLMDSTSRAKLRDTAAAVSVGSYNWGVITWAYPIKVNASVTTSNGVLTTQDGTITDNGTNVVTTSTTPFTTADSAEAIVTLPNGGTWFKFQNPFVITENDAVAGTEFELDLTFNPENLIRAFYYSGSADDGLMPSNLQMYDGTIGSSNVFYVPFIDLNPIPRKSTDKTIVETYLSNNGTDSILGTTDKFQVRLEIYYNSSDTDKTIYGATLRVIPTTTTDKGFTDIQKVSFISNENGLLNFQNYNKDSIISGFTRLSQVGETTEATISCGGTNAFTVTGCSDGQTLSPTFTLSSVKEL